MASERYEAQVRLLMRVLPLLRDQDQFALKGGTANPESATGGWGVVPPGLPWLLP